MWRVAKRPSRLPTFGASTCCAFEQISHTYLTYLLAKSQCHSYPDIVYLLCSALPRILATAHIAFVYISNPNE